MKHLLQSKTVWFNIVVFIVMIAEWLLPSGLLPAGSKSIEIVTMIATVGNIILRVFFTDTKLTVNKKSLTNETRDNSN